MCLHAVLPRRRALVRSPLHENGSVKSVLKGLFVSLSLLAASVANADWHTGKVRRILIGYDGASVGFVVEGHSRNNCACYAVWPDTMCLNRARASFKEEVALLYMARARGSTISYNINETTCQVEAIYESD